MFMFGPWALTAMEVNDSALLGSTVRSHSGFIFSSTLSPKALMSTSPSGPRVSDTAGKKSSVSVIFPPPAPMYTPIRTGSTSPTSRPLSAQAKDVEATPSWTERRISLSAFRSMCCRGLKSLTSPPMRTGKVEAS